MRAMSSDAKKSPGATSKELFSVRTNKFEISVCHKLTLFQWSMLFQKFYVNKGVSTQFRTLVLPQYVRFNCHTLLVSENYQLSQ